MPVIRSTGGASCSPTFKIIINIERIISYQIIINLSFLVALWNWNMVQFIKIIVRIAIINHLIIILNILIQAIGSVYVFQILRIYLRFSLKSMLCKLVAQKILVLIILIELAFILQLDFTQRWNSAVPRLFFRFFKLVMRTLIF